MITGCASLPSLEGRTATYALADTAGTRLGSAVAPSVAANPGKTGIHALPDPHDAFAARVLLAAATEKSIDVQYFIWHGDQVGYLLFEALWQAAERGVRVRLLLDDLNTRGLDPTIAALDAHPNIEVRLYNPFVQRDARALNFLTDFTRMNRRMHNKSFTADNQVSVVGGRNIGNEYFGAASGVGFVDLDVLALGMAVRDVSKEFDLYWNSASAYPAMSFVGAPGPEAAANLKATFSAMRADPESVAYLESVRETPLIRDLLNKQLVLEWTNAQLVYDDPAKTLDTTARTDVLLFPELVRTLGRPDKGLDLVSPYFVPGAEGTTALEALARTGVKVRILTNSLAASDVKPVHAGYAKRRQDLLRAGVQLYELKPTAAKGSDESKARFGASSSAALHAKTFAVDRNRIFVGSFNFDPRSALLNTEMGLVIESPTLAQRLTAFFDTEVPTAAYEVRLAPEGRDLEWIEQTPSGGKRYDTDPGTSWILRRQVDILSMLPIEWLL
ncbi:MAG TPA: phospholipase D family protein [Casimicrobiaceae bacterium]